MASQIIFIVWRESIEALLVVGILHAWLKHSNFDGKKGLRYLWGGVAAGLLLAALLATILLAFAAHLSGDSLPYFNTALMLIAAVLISQMVLWMRKNARTLKSDLVRGLDAASQSGRWIGVSILAMIAVGREGSETVVFLYGMLAAGPIVGFDLIFYASLAGFALAFLSYYLLQLGGKYISWRLFFKVTEIMLLLLACALFVSGVTSLISIVFGSPAPLWDSSWLLDDTTRFGSIVSTLTGYRAEPNTPVVTTWIIYWSFIIYMIKRSSVKVEAK